MAWKNLDEDLDEEFALFAGRPVSLVPKPPPPGASLAIR